jgi:hypothetical protein
MAMKPEVIISHAAQKIETKFQRLCLCYSGSTTSTDPTSMPAEVDEHAPEIQDSGYQRGSYHIYGLRKDRYEISTAIYLCL